jgi:hypothetical protein
MAKGRSVLAVALAVAGAAGVVAWRRRLERRERVDLYLADGSMVSFQRGSVEAKRLLPMAREILSVAESNGLR